MIAEPLVLNAPSKTGAVIVDTPVILAPMAGVTTAPFRQLCAQQGAGLYLCEMITCRALVIGSEKTKAMMVASDQEKIRSVQLYGVDPATVGQAVEICCTEYEVDHIDLNFGCPVPKVTKKGGGGVLPWKLDRLEQIISTAVTTADKFQVPVTVKTRIGIDFDHITYLDVGRIAEQSGAAGICLHARTVAEAYSGKAHWEYIANLVQHVVIPVIGNGDIWEAEDGMKMLQETGCAGIEIGRGCLGRPWLFYDLAETLSGRPTQTTPKLGEVCAMIVQHAKLQVKYFGEEHGMPDLRKHIGWYLRGFPVGGEIRQQLGLVKTVTELEKLLDLLNPQAEFPAGQLGKPRGRQGTPRRKVIMPYGWLDTRNVVDSDLAEAEQDVSGG